MRQFNICWRLYFKQDFSLLTAKDSVYQEWVGHAWVELDNLICDLSFFRTLYSDSFDKPYKGELIEVFGKGRGALIASPQQLATLNLIYQPMEELSDEMATGIINGLDELLKK
ncbi:MAG: hypothetical protein KF862_12310 [Chitinophagaceae bacterium]|nr:hypothetical protein [Chitinophagaceae bacterium]